MGASTTKPLTSYKYKEMSILTSFGSKLQQIKGRAIISTKLCGRSWRLVVADQSITSYVFKSDGQLLITRNGDLMPAKWDYRTENDSLYLIDRKGEGHAFQISFLSENNLISLVKIGSTENYFFYDENSAKAPKTFAQIEDMFVANTADHIIHAAELLPEQNLTGLLASRGFGSAISFFCSDLDSLLKDIDDVLLVRIIDQARKKSPKFENEIYATSWRLEKQKQAQQRLDEKRETANIVEELKKQGASDLEIMMASGPLVLPLKTDIDSNLLYYAHGSDLYSYSKSIKRYLSIKKRE